MLDKIKSVQFVMIVSFVSSLLLAFVDMSLKREIDKNILLDKKRSILKSINLKLDGLPTQIFGYNLILAYIDILRILVHYSLWFHLNNKFCNCARSINY